eukprot:s2324_g4.t1
MCFVLLQGNERAARPEPCAAGFFCPAGTSNRTTGSAAEEPAAAEATAFVDNSVAEEGFNFLCSTSELSSLKVKHQTLEMQSAVAGAKLDAVKAELEQTSAAKARLEEKLKDLQTRFRKTRPPRLATEVLPWYASLPAGSWVLAATAVARHPDFPVEMAVEDDRKVIAVHCPGVTIHDLRVEYDGVSQGKIQIERKEAQGVPPLQWERQFQFDSHHEFVQCEDGILRVSFKSVKPQPQVFRVPQVFHMALDDESETLEGKIPKGEQHQAVSVKSLEPWPRETPA